MVVNDEGLRVFTCDTRTGRISSDLPVSAVKWGTRLNKAGPLTANLHPGARELQHLNVRADTEGIVRSLGVSYGPHVLECGPIWGRDYDHDSGVLTLTASGLWSLFDWRKALPGRALDMAGEQVTYQDLNLGPSTLGGIARELVRTSLEDNPFGAGGLNVALPPVPPPGVHVRNYKGYELRWIGESLRQLTTAENGPDIRFRPRFKAGDRMQVEWVLEYGTEEQPLLQQVGNPWQWDGTRPQSGVRGFSTTESFEGMGAKAWAPGGGQERAMLLETGRDDRLLKAGYPWLEVDYASKQEEDRGVLRGRMQRRLYEAGFSVQNFNVKVSADTDPKAGAYLPGDWADVTIPADHPTLDPGRRRVRILAVDGDQGNTVTLTVAGILGNTAGGAYGELIPAPPGAVSPAIFPGAEVFPGANVYPS